MPSWLGCHDLARPTSVPAFTFSQAPLLLLCIFSRLCGHGWLKPDWHLNSEVLLPTRRAVLKEEQCRCGPIQDSTAPRERVSVNTWIVIQDKARRQRLGLWSVCLLFHTQKALDKGCSAYCHSSLTTEWELKTAKHRTEPENAVDEMLAAVKGMGIFLLTTQEPRFRTVISLFFFFSSLLQGFEGSRRFQDITKH